MTLLLALILAPLGFGLGLRCLRADGLRKILVTLVTLAVWGGSIALALQPTLDLKHLPCPAHYVSTVMMVLEILMGLYVIYVGIRARNPLVVLLMVAQSTLLLWFEFTQGQHLEATQDLFVDNFALIMALINGLVGGGICLYALGYMREYHTTAHADVPDRRPLFFALLFIFMGAMFGLIFSNNLLWLFFFWEITTFCSFLLIGYTQTPEARRNALRALVMNLVGGLAFAIAIVYGHKITGSIELQTLLANNKSLLLLPAALLCFAGITKAAQLPFSSWLLGAMVAPTPVSALLHSSTMVKAGVYMVLRMAPLITETYVGMLVALVGAVTFVVGSLAAITTSDAKRVLAWSTIANLGLIVLCGGIGTPAALWAGVLLIIFHAVAKCLLFLCVGVVEHKLHSRDIDAMSALIIKMPRVAGMMLVGMAGMFLAPFGMLISKWAVLKAVVDAHPLLSIFIVFGSSATLFFWVKWMGKLVQVVGQPVRMEKELHRGEAVAIYGLAVATFLACLLFPVISSHMIVPYIDGVYHNAIAINLGQGNITIMTIMMGLVVLFPIGFLRHATHARKVDAYLCGANSDGSTSFVGSAGAVENVTMNNYYMRGIFEEAWLQRWGAISCAILLAGMVVLVCR